MNPVRLRLNADKRERSIRIDGQIRDRYRIDTEIVLVDEAENEEFGTLECCRGSPDREVRMTRGQEDLAPENAVVRNYSASRRLKNIQAVGVAPVVNERGGLKIVVHYVARGCHENDERSHDGRTLQKSSLELLDDPD